jgi:hypothetical protein
MSESDSELPTSKRARKESAEDSDDSDEWVGPKRSEITTTNEDEEKEKKSLEDDKKSTLVEAKKRKSNAINHQMLRLAK